MAAGFTNEAGLGATTLFLRNLTGLWLLEQAIRQWQGQGKSVTISSLVNDAATVGPVRAAFDVSSGWSPAKTSYTVRMQCTSTDMAPPRHLLRSPAASCRVSRSRTDAQSICEQLTAEPVEEVHMIGGGSLNPLLRRLTADACGRPLRFGPVEATSLGSLAAQAVAVGDLSRKPTAQALAAKAQIAPRLPTTNPYDASGSNWIASSPLPERAMTSAHDLTDLVQLSRTLGEPARRLAILAEGNTSQRVAEDQLAVKATGRSLRPPRQRTLSWSV